MLQRAPAGALAPSSDHLGKRSVGTLSILLSTGLDRGPGHSSWETAGQRSTNADQSPVSESTERRGDRGRDCIRMLVVMGWQLSAAFCRRTFDSRQSKYLEGRALLRALTIGSACSWSGSTRPCFRLSYCFSSACS